MIYRVIVIRYSTFNSFLPIKRKIKNYNMKIEITIETLVKK